MDRFADNVEVGFNCGDERIDTFGIQIRHNVDVERRANLTDTEEATEPPMQ